MLRSRRCCLRKESLSVESRWKSLCTIASYRPKSESGFVRVVSARAWPSSLVLASFDGSLAKTNKAALPKLLEDGVDSLQHLPPQTSAVNMDAMTILQMLSKIPDRFSDLTEMVFNRILLQAGEATRVDFVGNQYPEI